MRPAALERNFTPTSSGPVSLVSAALAGVADVPQMLHGQDWLPLPIVTVTPAEGVSRLAVSSTARLRIVRLPEAPARKL